MIAELGITIFLLCNSPVMLDAERGRVVRRYTIYSAKMVNGQLEYNLKDQPNKEFVSSIEAEMKAHGIKHKFINKQYACNGA